MAHAGRPVARRFHTIHDPGLVERWTRLEESGRTTGFLSLDFARSMEDGLTPEWPGAPLYIAIDDGQTGAPLMIVPLLADTVFGVRRLEFLDYGIVDYHFPLVDPKACTDPQSFAAMRQAFAAALPPHDILLFSKVIREYRGVPNPLWTDGRLIEIGEGASRIELDPDSLERAQRNHSVYPKMAKQRTRLEKLPGFEIVEATTACEIDQILGVMARQRRKRMSAQGIPDLFQDPAVFAHYRRLAMSGCKDGRVLLLGLRVGDTWLATSYCLCHQGVVTGVLCSLDEGPYRKHSPGLIATILEIEWGKRHGFALYDFGAGSYGYKDRFGGRHRVIKTLGVPATLRGAACLAACRARIALRLWLRHRPALARTVRRAKSLIAAAIGRGRDVQNSIGRRAWILLLGCPL